MSLFTKFKLLLYVLLATTGVVVIMLGFSVIRYHQSKELGITDVNPETLSAAFREMDIETVAPKALTGKVRQAGGALKEKLTRIWPKIQPYFEFAGIFVSDKEASLISPQGNAEEKAKQFQEKYENRYQAVVDVLDTESGDQ